MEKIRQRRRPVEGRLRRACPENVKTDRARRVPTIVQAVNRLSKAPWSPRSQSRRQVLIMPELALPAGWHQEGSDGGEADIVFVVTSSRPPDAVREMPLSPPHPHHFWPEDLSTNLHRRRRPASSSSNSPALLLLLDVPPSVSAHLRLTYSTARVLHVSRPTEAVTPLPA